MASGLLHAIKHIRNKCLGNSSHVSRGPSFHEKETVPVAAWPLPIVPTSRGSKPHAGAWKLYTCERLEYRGRLNNHVRCREKTFVNFFRISHLLATWQVLASANSMKNVTWLTLEHHVTVHRRCADLCGVVSNADSSQSTGELRMEQLRTTSAAPSKRSGKRAESKKRYLGRQDMRTIYQVTCQRRFKNNVSGNVVNGLSRYVIRVLLSLRKIQWLSKAWKAKSDLKNCKNHNHILRSQLLKSIEIWSSRMNAWLWCDIFFIPWACNYLFCASCGHHGLGVCFLPKTG